MILGILQGVTEFLPVSSSGHLAVYQHFFRPGGPAETRLLFDVMVHLGTLLAVLVVFRADVAVLVSDTWRTITGKSEGDRGSLRLALLLAVGTVPAAVFGLGWKGELERLFSAPVPVGFAFLVTGSVLWLSRFSDRAGRLGRPRQNGQQGQSGQPGRPTKDVDGTTWVDALLIGLGQALALIPGISRSGTTISIALLLGLDRWLAARYSFLLAVPAILGAVAVQIGDTGGIPADQWAAVASGTVMAAVSGYVALRLLLRIVVAGNLSRFSYYCWGIGLLTLGGVLSGFSGR